MLPVDALEVVAPAVQLDRATEETEEEEEQSRRISAGEGASVALEEGEAVQEKVEVISSPPFTPVDMEPEEEGQEEEWEGGSAAVKELLAQDAVFADDWQWWEQPGVSVEEDAVAEDTVAEGEREAWVAEGTVAEEIAEVASLQEVSVEQAPWHRPRDKS